MRKYDSGVIYPHHEQGRLKINRIEPVQELMFERAVLRMPENGLLVNIGCAQGYYCLYGRVLRSDIHIHGYEAIAKVYDEAVKNAVDKNIAFFHKKITAYTGLCDVLSIDVQGNEVDILEAGINAKEVLIGTHSAKASKTNTATHEICLRMLQAMGYNILFESITVPLQPDGTIWAIR